ncbi:MAG TPA: hypothetical protein VE377_10190 [Candidatus Dormibacteraeota bacterium]|nr:hypothetical protein [Candidatus Dormibacteraeota bacterium]
MTFPRSTLLAIVTYGLLIGCTHAPKRPDTVPASAIWSGGPDGGAFIDCAPSQNGETNSCTVYNDGNGDVYMSGKFSLKGQGRGARADELKYGDADGTHIHLQDNRILEAFPAQRPASVPEKAMLAENGVYVDCHPSDSRLFQCSLFLAAKGEKIFTGSYRCDESLSVPCKDLAPKIADRSEINLQSAGALVLVK